MISSWSFKVFWWMLYVLLFGYLGGKYYLDSSLIREGESKQLAWDKRKEAAGNLSRLSRAHTRFLQGQQTLEGWRSSRYAWPEVLSAIKTGLPGDPQDIQLNRLQFDEEIEGLRKKIPGEEATDYYPLRRLVEITLSGIIRSDFPESRLREFGRNFREVNTGSFSVEDLSLTHSEVVLNKDRKPTDLTRFTYSIRLSPREVSP